MTLTKKQFGINLGTGAKRRFFVGLVIVFCAVVSWWLYMVQFAEVCACSSSANPLMNDILLGAKKAPFAYRRLTAWLLAGDVWRLAVFHLVGRLALFALTYIWVRRWSGAGLLAVALLCVALVVMYPTWYSSDYALTEAVILLVGWMMLSVDKWRSVHYWLYGGLVIVGSLNRETTGLLLVLGYGVMSLDWRRGSMYVASMAIVLIGVRVVYDAPASHYTVQYVLALNLTPWRLQGAVMYNGMLLLLWLAMLMRWRWQSVLGRIQLTLIPYVGLWLLFGIAQEVRLLLPVFLAVAPLIDER